MGYRPWGSKPNQILDHLSAHDLSFHMYTLTTDNYVSLCILGHHNIAKYDKTYHKETAQYFRTVPYHHKKLLGSSTSYTMKHHMNIHTQLTAMTPDTGLTCSNGSSTRFEPLLLLLRFTQLFSLFHSYVQEDNHTSHVFSCSRI